MSEPATASSKPSELILTNETFPDKPLPRSAEFRKARAAVAKMNSVSLAKCREAAMTLRTILGENDSESLHSMVRAAMRDLILSVPQLKSRSVSAADREIRSMALGVHRFSSQGQMYLYFKNTDFEYLDLFEMDLSSEPLIGFQFDHCFLVGSSLESCDLTECSFNQCWIRNVNFAGATLTRADFSGADWFNARHLTIKQMKTVRTETLLKCPENHNDLRAFLADHYAFPLAAWGEEARQQLLSAWDEYLRPDGLRDFVHQTLQTPR